MDKGYRDFFVHTQIGRSGRWEAVGQCQSAYDTWDVIFADPGALPERIAQFARHVRDSRDFGRSRDLAAATPPGDVRSLDDAASFGEELFNALFPANSLYRASLARTKQDRLRLRIRLSNEIPELSTVPWEFLYDPVEEKHVAVRTPLVRHTRLATFARRLQITPPLRILGVVASPTDLVELDVGAEMRRVKAEVDELPGATLEWLEHATYQELMNSLREGRWHILHYIGHGDYDEKEGKGLIVLEKEGGEGASHRLFASELSDLLEGHGSLSLCVLNSCNGAASSSRHPVSDTATTLIKGGMTAVIAMQYEIGDEAAVCFSRALYAALADGLPIDHAVCEARVAMRVEVRTSLEWGTPVLHMRSPDGELFDLSEGTTPLEPIPIAGPTKVAPTEQVLPSPIDTMLRTDDRADLIRVTSSPAPGEPGVRLCFELGKPQMWWKGLGFGGTDTPKLEGDGHGSMGCLTTVPGKIAFHFWKAKMFGVHTPVGKRTIDLTNYNEHSITFSWLSD